MKKSLFIAIYLILIPILPQTNASKLGENAREGIFAFKPGHYDMAILTKNPILDPGAVIEIDVYITGYGNINGAKMAFYASMDIFDDSKSEIYHGINKKDNSFVFGTQVNKFSGQGAIIGFTGGIKKSGWKNKTMFFDITEEDDRTKEIPLLSTERKLKRPPVGLKLKTLPNIKPGRYTIELLLTYFNGEEWLGSKKEIQFTIRNILQRNEILTWWIAIIATILASIAAFLSIIKYFRNNIHIKHRAKTQS